MDLQLSVITASRNRPDSLRRLGAALQGLPGAPWGTAWEWIVSLADYDRVPVLPLWARGIDGVSGHSSRSVNRLLAVARGRAVVLLADDLTPYAETLPRAEGSLAAHPQIAQGVFYVHTAQQACHVPMERGFPYAPYWIARRAVLEREGGYDETWRHYGVDYDLSCRLLDRGYGVAAIPGACLFDFRPWDGTMQAHGPTAREEGRAAAARWQAQETALRDRWRREWAPVSGPADCPLRTHG